MFLLLFVPLKIRREKGGEISPIVMRYGLWKENAIVDIGLVEIESGSNKCVTTIENE